MELHVLAASKGMELQELAENEQGLATIFKELERRSLEEQGMYGSDYLKATAGLYELQELAAPKGMELQELAATEQGSDTIIKDLARRSLEEQDLETTGMLVPWAIRQNADDELAFVSLEEDAERRNVYDVFLCSLYSAVGPDLGVADAIAP